jgi:hypothetical protein
LQLFWSYHFLVVDMGIEGIVGTVVVDMAAVGVDTVVEGIAALDIEVDLDIDNSYHSLD